jgi:hypothetical protein
VTQPEPGIQAVPRQIRQIGQEVVALAQDVGAIVASGAATIQLVGSGNAGFLTTPAMVALTAAHIAALKDLGEQMDVHGQTLSQAAVTYETTDNQQAQASAAFQVPTTDPAVVRTAATGPATTPAPATTPTSGAR